MRMNNHTQNGMAEATRLTQQGRLEEATATIQRALGGTYVPVSSPGGSGGADGPIDVDSWVVKETHHGPVAGRRAADRGPDAARRTSLPPNLFTRGVQHPSGMTAIIGATYPDLYAAVGVHSGLAPGAASDLSSAFTAMRQGGPVIAHENVSGRDREILPTIIFHGDGDTTVHPRNGDRLLTHLARGKNGSSPRVSTRRGRVQGGYEYTRFTYQDAEGRDLVERWSVHGLGHAWSGGSYPGSYTDPRGPDASAEMVRFFGQHHKR